VIAPDCAFVRYSSLPFCFRSGADRGISVLSTYLILKRKTPAGFFLVLVLHFIFDLSAVWLYNQSASVLPATGLILLAALRSLILIIKF
jgi:hypothetical protein